MPQVRLFPLKPGHGAPNIHAMFTIEHDFDATVITLVDEGAPHLQEDVTIEAFEDCVVVQQMDLMANEVVRITLSLTQLQDLTAALNLPEGSYRIRREKP